MAFEEKIEKYSTPGSTTKIREQRVNFLFLTDDSLVYGYEKFNYNIDASDSRFSEESRRETR